MEKEKPPIYDNEGRVINPDLARKAAEVEDKYHKKSLGIFKPSKYKLTEGMDQAERTIEHGEDLLKKRFWWEVIDIEKVPSIVKAEMEKLEKEGGWNWELTSVTRADIGGGITRYRIYARELLSSAPIYNEYELILDLKDNFIRHKEMRELIK